MSPPASMCCWWASQSQGGLLARAPASRLRAANEEKSPPRRNRTRRGGRAVTEVVVYAIFNERTDGRNEEFRWVRLRRSAIRRAHDYAEREGGLLRAACEAGCGLVLRGRVVRTRPCEPGLRRKVCFHRDSDVRGYGSVRHVRAIRKQEERCSIPKQAGHRREQNFDENQKFKRARDVLSRALSDGGGSQWGFGL